MDFCSYFPHLVPFFAKFDVADARLMLLGVCELYENRRTSVRAFLTITFMRVPRGEFRPRQTRQLPRAIDLKGRLLSCQSY